MPNVSAATFPIFNIGYGLAPTLSRAREVGEDVSFQDAFTQIIGRHTIKTGYELLRTRYASAVESLPSGSYTFGVQRPVYTETPARPSPHFCSVRLTSAVYTQDFAAWLPRWWNHSFTCRTSGSRSVPDPQHRRALVVTNRLSRPSTGSRSQFDPKAVDPLTEGWARSRILADSSQPVTGTISSRGSAWLGISGRRWCSAGHSTNDSGSERERDQSELQRISRDGERASASRRSAPRLSPVARPSVDQLRGAAERSVPYIGGNFSSRTAEWYDPNIRMPYVMSWSGGMQYEFSHNWLIERSIKGTAGVGCRTTGTLTRFHSTSRAIRPC